MNSETFAARLRRVDKLTRAAARRYGTSRLGLAARLGGHYFRRGIRPVEAIEAGLADPSLSEEALAGCFGKQRLMDLQDRLNPRELIGVTEDKAIFYPLCEALHVPSPALYAVIGRRGAWSADGRPLSGREDCERFLDEKAPDEFVVKPAAGVYGEGVSVLRRAAAGGFTNHAGRSLSAADLCASIFADRKYERFVVQERLTNHPAIVTQTGCAYLQTVRVATLVDREGVPRVLYAEWKIIGGDSPSDNFSYGRTGNFTANVALDTGALGPAMTLAKDGVGSQAIAAHPRTGAAFVGFRLPDWDALLALARRCALLFMPLRTVGWDMGLTPRGPMVVEGNRWWDPPTSSVAGPAAPGVALHPLSANASLLWR
jgi:hypothetical protein